MAKAVENRKIVLAIGVNGTNVTEMLELAAEAEATAVNHPLAKIALIARPPDDVRSEAELEKAWDALAEQEAYCPSVTGGDYSPSCPWNAPGMSVKDFI